LSSHTCVVVISVKSIALLLIVAATAAATPIYTVAYLGSLGGASATGYSVNDSGAVAGWGQNASGSQQAFVSTPSGLQALTPGGAESYAYGINDAGTVVGTTYVNGQAHGTIWGGSGTTDLGAGTYAMGISDSGEVVGGNGGAFAVVNGQLQSLGTLSGIGWSAAYGVNDSGTVVGDGQLANGNFRGIIWSPSGSMILLGTLGGGGSQATDINNSGEVVGFATLTSGYQHAFSAIDALMIDLGTLGGGSSFAYGVNDAGEIVGYSYLADGDQHAFLYYDGKMLDLNSLIPANSGWELLDAYGINASGQITGVGLYDGKLSAFLLTDPPAGLPGIAPVPEPHTAWPLAFALAIAVYRFRVSGLGLATGSRGVPSGPRRSLLRKRRNLDQGLAKWRAAGAGTTPHTAEITDRP
jgi:probable HAF family extracellular repeat protein